MEKIVHWLLELEHNGTLFQRLYMLFLLGKYYLGAPSSHGVKINRWDDAAISTVLIIVKHTGSWNIQLNECLVSYLSYLNKSFFLYLFLTHNQQELKAECIRTFTVFINLTNVYLNDHVRPITLHYSSLK